MDELKTIQKHIEKLSKKFDGKFAVLFSGGIDSGLVAYAAKDFADALTIDSEFTFRYKIEDAKRFAGKHGIRHRVIKVNCLDEKIKNNPPERCYLCKKKIIRFVKKLNYDLILDGTNAGDLKDARPGIKALGEENVVSPLVELKFGKKEIRKVMEEIDKDFSLKPHESCIATRIPFNSGINAERLKRIEAAENYIRTLDVEIARVMDYFPEAMIEVADKDFKLAFENRGKIVKKFKSIGYKTITLNLEVYNK